MTMKEYVENSISEITDKILNKYRGSITRGAFIEAMERVKGLLIAPSQIAAIDVIADQVLDKYRNSITRDAFIKTMELVKSSAFEPMEVTMETSGLSVPGHEGTWYAIDHLDFKDRTLYLMEHEEYGDEAAHIIVDQNGDLIQDEVWNGFEDYFEALSDYLGKHDLDIVSPEAEINPAPDPQKDLPVCLMSSTQRSRRCGNTVLWPRRLRVRGIRVPNCARLKMIFFFQLLQVMIRNHAGMRGLC